MGILARFFTIPRRLESVSLFRDADAAFGNCHAVALSAFSTAAAYDYCPLGHGFHLDHPDDRDYIQMTFRKLGWQFFRPRSPIIDLLE